MKKLTLLALALWCVAATAPLREIVTRSGVAYHKAEVTRVAATGISINHKDGVAFIEFWDLPVELQKEFGYDPTAFVELKRSELQAAEQARAARELAAQRAALQAEEAERTRQRAYEAQQQAAQASSIQSRDYSNRGYGSSPYMGRSYVGGYAPTPTPVASSGGTVSVSGYYRKDGTYVRGYTRRK